MFRAGVGSEGPEGIVQDRQDRPQTHRVDQASGHKEKKRFEATCKGFDISREGPEGQDQARQRPQSMHNV